MNKPLAAVGALLAVVLSYRSVGSNPSPGLDNSWKFAINHAFAEGLVSGRDLLFTFGPLGFLAQPMPLADNLLWATLFWVAVRLWAAGTLVWLAVRYASADGPLALSLRLLAVLLLLSLVRIPLYQLFLISAGSLLLFDRGRGRGPLLAAGAAAALALLIKIPYGVLCAAALAGYLAVHTWRVREPSAAGVVVAAFLLSYLGVWLLVGHTLAGSGRYLVAGAEFSSGSASGMSVDVPNDWRWLGASLLALVAAPLCFRVAGGGPAPNAVSGRGPAALAVAGLVLPPLFVWLRYGLGREDSAHYHFLMDFLAYGFGLLLVVAPGRWPAAGLAALAAVSLLAADINGRQLGFAGYPGWPQLRGARDLSASVISFRERDRRLREQAPGMLASLRLPPEFRERIGEACVDVYPWQTLIVRANELCWRVRPVFQSYIAYTPYLDGANAEHFRGDRAPEYVVWHAGNLTSIVDGRYLLNDEPLALYELLRRYAPVERAGDLLLFARSDTPRLAAPGSLGFSDGRFGEWIDVPVTDAAILRARLEVSRTPWGRLRRALYKESPTYVEYRFRDGAIARHRMVIDNAASGLWVSPFLRALDVDPVLAVDPAEVAPDPGTAPPAHWVDRVEPGDGRLLVSGWAHRVGEDARGQRVSLVLSADGRAYRVAARPQSRRDVTEHFAESGLDLDESGFVAVLDLGGVAPGVYDLDVVVEREGSRAAARWREPVRIEASAWEPAARVEKLRVVDSAGGAFVPELRVEWLGIRGEHPFVVRGE